MPYLIDATDGADAAALRAEWRPAHLAFLESSLKLVIAAGAKLSDDGETPLGSLYLVDVDDRAAAEAFIADDPYVRAGVFSDVRITRWRKGFLDHRRTKPGGKP
jgi:hypothetical protein